MMYTAGDKATYDKSLRDPKITRFQKTGASETYEGGMAFINYHDALSWIEKNNLTDSYKVYGLDCTLDDTYWNPNRKYRCLLRDVDIIMLSDDTKAPFKLRVIEGGKE